MSRVAESLHIPFFVVGAMAREIILVYCYNIRTTRATEDIDFGVQVSNWEKYELMREGLVATGSFTETRRPQRLGQTDRLLDESISHGELHNRLLDTQDNDPENQAINHRFLNPEN